LRLLTIFGIALAVTCAGLAAAYSAGLIQLMLAGYPQPVWPASGAFEIVAGAPKPVRVSRPPARLNPRGEELFEASDSRALLVMRNGSLDLETYADGIRADTRLNSYSLVKSLIGALVLKAVSEGKLRTLDDPVGTYMPGFAGQAFQKTPVRDFLEMRSGLDFERDGADKQDRLATYNPFGKLAQLHTGGLSAVESHLTARAEDRGSFIYQNVNTAVLGRLLSEVYRTPLYDLLSEKIWQPAGAEEAYWLRHAEGTAVTAYCCLYATPLDWIRVGQFLMENGTPGSPFLRQDLWQEFFGRGLSRNDLSSGVYGLHIRHNILDRKGEALQGPFSYMMGQGGQIVYMMPDRHLVAVRFGEHHALLHSTLYSLWNSLPPPGQ